MRNKFISKTTTTTPLRIGALWRRVCVRFAWTCRAGSASCFACALCATCSSSVGPWWHKGHKPRLELQCLFLSLLFLSVRLSICLIWVYATFMLINTFMTCATVSSPLSSPLRLSTGNCQFGLNFNWPIWACFGAACSCQAKPSCNQFEVNRSRLIYEAIMAVVNRWVSYECCKCTCLAVAVLAVLQYIWNKG